MEESFTSIDELLALLDSILDSEVSNLLVVTLDWLDIISNELGNYCFAEFDCSMESVVA